MSVPDTKLNLFDNDTFEHHFYRCSHKKFVHSLDSESSQQSFEYLVSEHLRMSGIYWACMAMDLLQGLEEMKKSGIIEFVLSCQCENGGFSGNIGHDPHLLYTTSAIQILALFDELHQIDIDKVANCK